MTKAFDYFAEVLTDSIVARTGLGDMPKDSWKPELSRFSREVEERFPHHRDVRRIELFGRGFGSLAMGDFPEAVSARLVRDGNGFWTKADSAALFGIVEDNREFFEAFSSDVGGLGDVIRDREMLRGLLDGGIPDVATAETMCGTICDALDDGLESVVSELDAWAVGFAVGKRVATESDFPDFGALVPDCAKERLSPESGFRAEEKISYADFVRRQSEIGFAAVQGMADAPRP